MNLFERRYKRAYLTFSEKIIETEEKEIAELLEKFILVVNRHLPISTLRDIFTSDAKIDSALAARVVDLPEFIKTVREGNYVHTIFLDQIRIIRSGSSFQAHGIQTVFLKSGIRRIHPNSFTFTRTDHEDWKISQTRYGH